MFQKALVKFFIVVAAIALHKVFFEPTYKLYLESQGMFYDFGAAFLGYAMFVGFAWIFAVIITRPMKKVRVLSG